MLNTQADISPERRQPQADDRAAHVAHFTAAVYTGLHTAEERLQSQIHTLEGGHGQTAVFASPYRIVLAHQRELTALAGEGDRPSRHASRRSWTAPL